MKTIITLYANPTEFIYCSIHYCLVTHNAIILTEITVGTHVLRESEIQLVTTLST